MKRQINLTKPPETGDQLFIRRKCRKGRSISKKQQQNIIYCQQFDNDFPDDTESEDVATGCFFAIIAALLCWAIIYTIFF